MRNRVAHGVAQHVQRMRAIMARVAVLIAVPAILVGVTAHTAYADPAVAVEQLSSSAAGPVGIVAVLIGVGGLVAGLLRRRRITTRPPATVAEPQPVPTPAAQAASGSRVA